MFVYGIPFVVLVCTEYLQLHIAYKVQISKCKVQHEAGSIAKNKQNNKQTKNEQQQQKQRNTQGKYTDGSTEWQSSVIDKPDL